MEPSALDVLIAEVVGKVLGESFCQCGDQHPITRRDALFDLSEQVVDLALGRNDLDDRIEKPRRTDHLFDDFSAGLLQLVVPRRGRYIDDLVDLLFPFVEFQRAIVQRAGQTKAVIDEACFSVVVAEIHRADLGNRHVGFIDDDKVIFWEKIMEGIGS